MLLRDFSRVLMVKIVAGVGFRIKAARERTNLTRPDAIKFIPKINKKRDECVKFLYHVDRNDISTYDPAINLMSISMSSACDLVSKSASLPEYQPSPKSQKQIDDLLLATDVRAKITAANITDDHDTKIDADDGTITIERRMRNLLDADRVREAVRLVELAAATYWHYLAQMRLMFVLFIYASFSKGAHLIYRTSAMTYAKQTGKGVERPSGLFAVP